MAAGHSAESVVAVSGAPGPVPLPWPGSPESIVWASFSGIPARSLGRRFAVLGGRRRSREWGEKRTMESSPPRGEVRVEEANRE